MKSYLTCLALCLALALAEEAPPMPPSPSSHHATVVCIEFHPKGQAASPVQMCGPIVHDGHTVPEAEQQRQHQPQQRQQQPQQQQQLGETRSAEPPCAAGSQGFQRSSQPMAMMRSEGPMIPSGWRQAGSPPQPAPQPPCDHPSHEQDMRAVMHMPVMGMGPIPMGMPLLPPMSLQRPRSWFVPPHSGRAHISAEETDQPKAAQQEQPKSAQSEEEVEAKLKNLLEDCDNKAKQIKEKDVKIQQLMAQIEQSKATPNKPPQQKQ